MTRQINTNSWQFRREITMGTMLHAIVLVMMIVVAWFNLEKELALIRNDLNQLNTTNTQLGKQLEQLTKQCTAYEYRLRNLEKQTNNKQITRKENWK